MYFIIVMGKDLWILVIEENLNLKMIKKTLPYPTVWQGHS